MLKRLLFLMTVLCTLAACKKDRKVTDPSVAQSGIYADSIFYVQSTANTVMPVKEQSGTYVAFPDGLELDPKTGAIDVNKSETGLKYRITFTPASQGMSQTSYIVVSGINYADKIYNLANGDSIAAPIYNADVRLEIPDANKSTVFDEKGGCKKAGIVLNKGNAMINLARSVRNQGIDTGATEEVRMQYRINDKSNLADNELRVKLYFYRNVSEIPEYLTALLEERKKSILTMQNSSASFSAPARGISSLSAKLARSRPPCIIVVSR